MRNILHRAWRDTRKSVGLKWRTLVHYIAIPCFAVLLLWFVVGKKQAMDEIFVVLCYILIATLLFLLSFLCNLWLAPYKLMHERLDEIADAQKAPQVVDEEDGEEKAFRDLAPQIRDARDTLVGMSGVNYPLLENQSAVLVVVADIGTRLKRLGIPTPEAKPSDSIETVLRWWTAYLMVLKPIADDGGIADARCITFSDGKVDAPITPAGQGIKQ